MNEESPKCTHCGGPMEDGEWPDPDPDSEEGSICAGCWEAYCPGYWWVMVGQLPAIDEEVSR